jgi:hypothetical protein
MKKMALAALLSACASAPPRQLPASDWARGAKVYVAPSAGVSDTYNYRADLETQVEGDLRTAGAILYPQPQGADMQLLIVATNWVSVDPTVAVTLLKNGEPFDAFDFHLKDLPCMAMTGIAVCVGREIAARALESKGHARAPASAAATRTAQLAGKLAVLELRNFTKDLTRENAQYFTDVVRSAALKAQPQLEVMTRENLLVLLQASGKDLASCEGECEVDTGRRIGADEIVSGEIQKLGTLYKLSLRLHDTREGRLLASTQASGKSVEELDANAQAAAAELLGGR